MTQPPIVLSSLLLMLSGSGCDREVGVVEVAPKAVERADRAAERASTQIAEREQAAEATRDIVAQHTEASAAAVEAGQKMRRSVSQLRREMREVRAARSDFREARDYVVESARARMSDLEATAGQFLAEERRARPNHGDFEQPEDRLNELRMAAEKRIDELAEAEPDEWDSKSGAAIDAVARYARAIDEVGEPVMMHRPLRPYAPVAP